MESWFASGRIVDGILMLVAVEAAGLAWLGRRGRLPLPALLATLTSGAALMMALRSALTGAAWTSVAVWLLVGLVAHIADLGLRLRAGATAQRRSGASSGTPPQTPAFTRVTRLKEF